MRVFLVEIKHPFRKVYEVEATIKVCKKTVWAIEDSGQRHLMGSSAFITAAAAARCRYALVKRLVDDPYVKLMKPDVHRSAAKLLITLH